MQQTGVNDLVKRGIATGLIAAAASAGVLIGFGRAHRAAFRPLNAVAHVFIGSRAYLFDEFDLRVTTLGVLVHVASVVLWGVIFTALARRLRGWMVVGAALVFVGAAYVVDYAIVPERLRPGFEIALSRGEISVVYLVLAAALALGLKLTRTPVDIG
ncbi:MAG: hypothetical protein M3081_15515 [Gemmatimonadota bacterium]|nr:hypothetical protein [Gemmatimonadota bacterium]